MFALLVLVLLLLLCENANIADYLLACLPTCLHARRNNRGSASTQRSSTCRTASGCGSAKCLSAPRPPGAERVRTGDTEGGSSAEARGRPPRRCCYCYCCCRYRCAPRCCCCCRRRRRKSFCVLCHIHPPAGFLKLSFPTKTTTKKSFIPPQPPLFFI